LIETKCCRVEGEDDRTLYGRREETGQMKQGEGEEEKTDKKHG
jgi:hypothetical protein